MRFFPLCNAALLLLLLSGCCGTTDLNSIPCYKEMFTDSKETVQKREYKLDQKRPPRFNQ